MVHSGFTLISIVVGAWDTGGVMRPTPSPTATESGAMSTGAGASSPPYWQVPRLERRSRVIAGVAGGVAAEIGIDTLWVRFAFVLLFAAGGWGGLLYVVLWGVLAWHEYRSGASVGDSAVRRVPKGRDERDRLVGFALVVLGLFGAFLPLLGLPTELVIPLGVFQVGLVVVWRQLGPRAEGAGDRSGAGVGERSPLDWSQIAGGLIVMVLALAVVLWPLVQWNRAGQILAVGTGLGLGLAALSAPWWWRLLADLDAERQARARSDERAEVAAHLHDSVLQTLSLIQRHGDDPQTMVNLARRQERELRNWLDPRRVSRRGESIRGQFDQLATDVEALHGVPVEVVVVGDCLVEDGLEALVAAAREAVVNAAKHAGAERIDCYVEVGPTRVEAFIRDSGVGFDPDDVAEDRRGLRDSIEGRIRRAGGRAEVISSPGAGTEVELMMPRARAAGHESPTGPESQAANHSGDTP